jgi:hypothetical protein
VTWSWASDSFEFGLAGANPYRTGQVMMWTYGTFFGDIESALYLSNNYGSTWQAVAAPNGTTNRTMDYTNFYFGSRTIYYIGLNSDIFNNQFRRIADNQSLFYSIDQGQSWHLCGSPGDFVSIGPGRVVVDPQNDQHLYLGTQYSGVFESTNGCRSWELVNQGLGSLRVNSLAMDWKNPDTIYAATNEGAYVSYDGGQSWGAISEGIVGPPIIFAIAVDPQDSGHVVAVTPYGIFSLVGP